MIEWSSLGMAKDNKGMRRYKRAEFHSAEKFGEGMAYKI
jgi:hypothetical protein